MECDLSGLDRTKRYGQIHKLFGNRLSLHLIGKMQMSNFKELVQTKANGISKDIFLRNGSCIGKIFLSGYDSLLSNILEFFQSKACSGNGFTRGLKIGS